MTEVDGSIPNCIGGVPFSIPLKDCTLIVGPILTLTPEFCCWLTVLVPIGEVQFIISAHEKKGTLGITAKEQSSPSLLLPQY